MEANSQQRVKNLSYEGQVDNKEDKLILPSNVFRSLFNFCLSGIKNVLKHGDKPDTIMFVGGFAESPYLIGMLRKHFCDYKILVPEDPSHVALRGAVMFGFDPTIIKS
jgi:sugar (pentulose or hexulose) kinase